MIETVRVFTGLSEEFVELFMKHHPVSATDAGIHDYDHLMPDDSPEGLKERAAWLRDLEQRLVASVPWDELPIEPRVDYALLRSRISAMRADLEEIKVHQKSPALYLMRAFQGVHLLLSRQYAPLDERKEAAVARLMALPDYLEGAQANLQIVPPALLQIGMDLASQGPGFVDDVVRTLLRGFPGEGERLEHAGSRARTGFLRFREHLEKQLAPKAEGSFAIGERWMNYKLEREHLLPWTCTELEKIGREHVEHARIMLEEEAKRVDPRRDWRQLIADGYERSPESNWLRETYVTELDRAKRFVQERRLVPMPPSERLDVLDTPGFLRSTHPYATYQPPAPFDADQTGLFYITPIDLRRPKEAQKLQLQGHCLPALPIIALHEGYPGQHLQRCHANRASSRLRRLTTSDLFLEGWALYCEDLMWEQGFYTNDPLSRLFQLRDLLWRACRVVLDCALHSGRMTFEEGVDYLVQEVMLDRESAISEVRRYAITPTQPMSYLVGKLQIDELRDEARAKLGTRFDLHDFHGALLASGTLPPALVREELWERLGVS